MSPSTCPAPLPGVKHHASYVPMLSIAERDRRWNLIREQMAQEGLDCLLIYGNDVKTGMGMGNMRYITHIGSVEGGYAVFPLVGEPVVWTDLSHQHFPNSRYCFTQTWVNDIRPDQGPPPVVKYIKEKGWDKGNIGLVSYGASILFGEMIPAGIYQYIVKELNEARIISATRLINTISLIKSAEEIQFMEKSCEITNKVIKRFVEAAEPGKTEAELFADMIHEQVKQGSEALIFILLSSGPVEGPGEDKQLLHGNHQPTVPSNRILEKGDLIIFEMHASYAGYLSAAEFSLYLGGKAPEPLKRIHDVCIQCSAAVRKAMKPGATMKEVVDAERKPCIDAGMDYLELGFHQHGLESAGAFTIVHKEGHGKITGEKIGGIQFRENMVFGTNIDIHDPRWKKDVGLVFGDTMHVAKDGARLLVKTPTDIFEKPV